MTDERRKIFISYSWKDSEVAQSVVQALPRENYNVWIDRENIKAGDRVASAIVDALKGTDYYVILIRREFE